MTEQRQRALWDDGFACGIACSLDPAVRRIVVSGASEYRIWCSGWRMGRVARGHATD